MPFALPLNSEAYPLKSWVRVLPSNIFQYVVYRPVGSPFGSPLSSYADNHAF